MRAKEDAAALNSSDVRRLAVSNGPAPFSRFAGDPIADGKFRAGFGCEGRSAGEGWSAFACGTSAFVFPRWSVVRR